MLARTMIALAATLLLACSGAAPMQEPTQKPAKEVVVKEGQRLIEPYRGQESLEERILKAAVIARVELASHRIVGAPWGDRYAPAVEFTFDVLEYLKGTGTTTLTAFAYGHYDGRGYLKDTPAEALEYTWMLGEYRDVRWDDRQAIVFLEQPVAGGAYVIGKIGWRKDSRSVEVLNTLTVSDDERQAWLPESTPRGDSKSGVTGSSPEQHFFLEDPGATTTAAASSATPTISKTSLKAMIVEIEGAITSDAYRECLIGRQFWIRVGQEQMRQRGYFGITDRPSLDSGSPADTQVSYPLETYSGRENYTIKAEWLIGKDKDLFITRNGYLHTNRPLPQGEYHIFFNWTTVEIPDCGPHPKEILEYHRILVTVTAPAGTLAESFFDPYASSTAIVGTTTVGTISWQSGTVTADLTRDVTGHVLDFIDLDGTTTLSLPVSNATTTGRGRAGLVGEQAAVEGGRQADAEDQEVGVCRVGGRLLGAKAPGPGGASCSVRGPCAWPRRGCRP